MAAKAKKLAESNPTGIEDNYASSVGNSPKVSDSTLESDDRVITSVDQAISVINTVEWDAQKLIKNAAKITSLKQGRRPYDTKKLEKQGKGYKTNISSGAYATTLRRVSPRLYGPLLSASTLTAAELPAGTVNGEQKTAHWRETITNAIRSWPRWAPFCRLLTQEIVDYGFAFAAFTDRYDWRPHLSRMDRGFVPAGTEIMDLEPAFFALKWDYQPAELLKTAKDAIDAGLEGWDKESVAWNVQQSKPSVAPSREPTGWRKWEELIREQVWSYATAKNFRVVESVHLFAKESTGKVSQFIIVKDADEEYQLLYEKFDAFDNMSDVVLPIIFNSTDGTVHGSWGAGHLLYELGGLQEKIFCDMVDNLRNANKQRLQVKAPSEINDVRQVVNDTEVIVSGAEFANNLGGVQQNVDAYIKLRDILQQQMDSKVGAYVPPIPSQSSDVKAAAINAAMVQEKEVSDDSIEHYLSQIAYVLAPMIRRLTDTDSPLPKAKEVLEELKKKLSDDEIEILRSQPTIRSVSNFTPMAAQARGQFAEKYLGNAIFKQVELAKLITEGVPSGGTHLAEAVVIQEGDQTEQTIAERQQTLENTTLKDGTDVKVATTDNHWVHMQAMKQPLIQAVNAKLIPAVQAGLRHYTTHWTAGVSLKVLPDEAINAEKSFIADVEKALQALQQAQAQQQAMQQQQAAQQQAALQQQGGMAPGAQPPVDQGLPPQVGGVPGGPQMPPQVPGQPPMQ